MSRKSFFEAMQRDINLNYEYNKLEKMICEEILDRYGLTLNNVIEKHFRDWRDKDNYSSFPELRVALGFKVTKSQYGLFSYSAGYIDTNKFLLYCEMILNLLAETIKSTVPQVCIQVEHVLDVIRADIAKLNHKRHKTDDGRYILVQCDAATSSVADIVEPAMIDPIIEYNHYLLRGDIDKKRILLKKIADDLEPKQGRLVQLNKAIKDDLFYLFNNMNIRHNNSDPSSSDFNATFAKLTDQQKEDLYDDTYQLALYAYLTIENVKRMQSIRALKQEG